MEPGWEALEDDRVQVLEAARHRRRLQRGALCGNRFRIRLRDVEADRGALEARLERIGQGGIPNCFGPQRFGRNGANLVAARRWFEADQPRIDRHRRGLYLSTARSFLFNQVLARRVADGTWNRVLSGEVVHLDGTRSRFRIDGPDEAIFERLSVLDLHPGGPLWGRGAQQVSGACAALEADCLAAFALWREGLERAGLRHDRRPLRVRVEDLQHRWEGRDLVLAFGLPPGAYATALLREIVSVAA
jgi:tRNA pseudouridine13 synthase